MRTTLLAIVACALLGTAFAAWFLAPRGFTQVIPGIESVRFDIELRAVRQTSHEVTDPSGAKVRHELTLLGPAERILAPWLRVEAGVDGQELRALDGAVFPVPDGTKVAIWHDSVWVFSGDAFPDIAALRELDDGSALPPSLRSHAPERADLIDRAFPGAPR